MAVIKQYLWINHLHNHYTLGELEKNRCFQSYPNLPLNKTVHHALWSLLVFVKKAISVNDIHIKIQRLF